MLGPRATCISESLRIVILKLIYFYVHFVRLFFPILKCICFLPKVMVINFKVLFNVKSFKFSLENFPKIFKYDSVT